MSICQKSVYSGSGNQWMIIFQKSFLRTRHNAKQEEEDIEDILGKGRKKSATRQCPHTLGALGQVHSKIQGKNTKRIRLRIHVSVQRAKIKLCISFSRFSTSHNFQHLRSHAKQVSALKGSEELEKSVKSVLSEFAQGFANGCEAKRHV